MPKKVWAYQDQKIQWAYHFRTDLSPSLQESIRSVRYRVRLEVEMRDQETEDG